MFKWLTKTACVLTAVAMTVSAPVLAESHQSSRRLMDMVDILGVRSNELVGYGLVVGLDGTGDKTRQTQFTAQSMNNMLRQLGIQMPEGANPNLKNIAAVSVTATLPPFGSPGQSIDVTVSSIGDASSLQGGTLLMSQLKGADGQVYALAQGNLIVTGMSARGNSGSSVTVNIPTAARIPNGAIIERAVPSSFASKDHIELNLRSPNFTTAGNIVRAINEKFGPETAWAENGATVRVGAPADPSQRVAYMSVLETMRINEGDTIAKVVLNSRTGTVVMNEHIRLRAAAVSHGNLVVTIREDFTVSQPPGFSGGDTVVVPNTNIVVDQGDKHLFMVPEGNSLQDVVNAINAVGATPADLMAVLQALEQAGALQAELLVI
ncbi:flagellar P-ring protein FlgI [Endozoicomonas montiporae]|uniref:Flagellar P-ring protein n=2 Tax=Endozoicomonas montiporae TaxID=1027273 RepID=A0A081NC76_9GAMM|nr:flagellar basal body P-ring protein FlgI [Endozoicomonas montiporae]AMO56381.1 flagellar P-ring protein FlgI [Endozoicomonas montiporae CL-33]KEQ16049.1 flagellar P-ring protein FlgI [Endozoicomonas montiporae]